ncbi:MAG: hypothetical protein Q9165_006978 [Trypethelium subeluteriae]
MHGMLSDLKIVIGICEDLRKFPTSKIFKSQWLQDISRSKHARDEGDNSPSLSSKSGGSGDPFEGRGPYGGPYVPAGDRLPRHPSPYNLHTELEGSMPPPPQSNLSRQAHSQSIHRRDGGHPEVPQQNLRMSEHQLPGDPSLAPVNSRSIYQTHENRSGSPPQDPRVDQREQDMGSESGLRRSRTVSGQNANPPRDPKKSSAMDKHQISHVPASEPAHSQPIFTSYGNRSRVPQPPPRSGEHSTPLASGSGLARSQTMPQPDAHHSLTTHQRPVSGDDPQSWPFSPESLSYQAYRPRRTRPRASTDIPTVTEYSPYSPARYQRDESLQTTREPLPTGPPLSVPTKFPPTETHLPPENSATIEIARPYREQSLNKNSVPFSERPRDGSVELSRERSLAREQLMLDGRHPAKKEAGRQKDQQQHEEHGASGERVAARYNTQDRRSYSIQGRPLNPGPPVKKKQVHWETSRPTSESWQSQSSETPQGRSQRDPEYLRSLEGRVERIEDNLAQNARNTEQNTQNIKQNTRSIEQNTQSMLRTEQTLSRLIDSFNEKASRRLKLDSIEQDLQSRNRVAEPRQFRRSELMSALELVADHLKGTGPFRIVATGGIVNCLFLNSRPSTKDINFFTTELSQNQWNLLREAIAKVYKYQALAMTDNCGGHVPQDSLSLITRQAIHDNVLIFQHRALSLYAAPFDFQMLAKIDRWGSDDVKNPPLIYDLPDAAVYLHQYLNRSRYDMVSWEWWVAAFERYQTLRNHPDRAQMRIRLAMELNDEFNIKYGRDGISASSAGSNGKLQA